MRLRKKHRGRFGSRLISGSDRGFVMVTVLGVLSVLLIGAIAFNATTLFNMNEAKRNHEMRQALDVVETGARRAAREWAANLQGPAEHNYTIDGTACTVSLTPLQPDSPIYGGVALTHRPGDIEVEVKTRQHYNSVRAVYLVNASGSGRRNILLERGVENPK